MPKVKDKAAQENQLVTYRGVPIRLSISFSNFVGQKGLAINMKSRDLQPKLLYPTKLSLRIEGQIKSFPDKKKTKGVHPQSHNYMNFLKRYYLFIFREGKGRRKRRRETSVCTCLSRALY